jgi:hypothetical protein
MTHHPRNRKTGTGFWVAHIIDGVKTLSPARMIVYLRIANLQEHPAMITRYSLTAHSSGDSGRCRSVFRGMPITRSGLMAIMIPG